MAWGALPATLASLQLVQEESWRRDHLAAAELYLGQASKARSPRREDLLLHGAASLIRAGDTLRATAILDGLVAAELTEDQQHELKSSIAIGVS